MQFRLNFIIEANTNDYEPISVYSIHPDQTASKGKSNQGPWCLQYRLSKNITRQGSRRQKSWLAGKFKVFPIYQHKEKIIIHLLCSHILRNWNGIQG